MVGSHEVTLRPDGPQYPSIRLRTNSLIQTEWLGAVEPMPLKLVPEQPAQHRLRNILSLSRWLCAEIWWRRVRGSANMLVRIFPTYECGLANCPLLANVLTAVHFEQHCSRIRTHRLCFELSDVPCMSRGSHTCHLEGPRQRITNLTPRHLRVLAWNGDVPSMQYAVAFSWIGSTLFE